MGVRLVPVVAMAVLTVPACAADGPSPTATDRPVEITAEITAEIGAEIGAEVAAEITPELSRARTAPAGLRHGFQAAWYCSRYSRLRSKIAATSSSLELAKSKPRNALSRLGGTKEVGDRYGGGGGGGAGAVCTGFLILPTFS